MESEPVGSRGLFSHHERTLKFQYFLYHRILAFSLFLMGWQNLAKSII